MIWDTFLSVLGVIGIVAVASFIIVFLSDLFISIIDGSNGIFFKRHGRKYADDEKNSNKRPKLLEKPHDALPQPNDSSDGRVFNKQVEDVFEDDLEQDGVDLDKARQEEILANTDNAFVQKTDYINQNLSQDEEIQQQIAEERRKALEELNRIEEEKKALEEKAFEQIEEERRKRIEAEMLAEEEKNKRLELEKAEEDRQKQNEEQLASEEENKINEFIDEVANSTLDEINQNDNVVEVSQDTQSSQNDESDKLESEREAFEQREAELIKQIEELKQQIDESNKTIKDLEEKASEEVVPMPSESREELEARLEVLKQRLKENEKELSANRKEYIPLRRINNTLESGRKKLRRKEAIVANQKRILYGVNNYVDIDEEKAEKLSEELDLLEGLKLSIQHCEEVMQKNKDRYPILERVNQFLVKSQSQIKADIAEIEQKIARIDSEENPDSDENQDEE